MHPLHSLLPAGKTKAQPVNWIEEALVAFHATKDALANASLL